MSRSLAAAPPSTRSSRSLAAPPPAVRPASARIASTTSRVWNAIDSSAARATWPRVVPRVRPTSAPRASARHRGAPSPRMRDEHDAARVRDRPGQRLAVGGVREHAEPIAQPLNRRAGDEHAALQRVRGLALRPARDSREQAGPRGHGAGAGVEQQEAPGAVRFLDWPGRTQPCPNSAACWSPATPRSECRRAASRAQGVTEHAARGHDFGQHCARHAEAREQRVVSDGARCRRAALREAFVGSGGVHPAPVSFHATQLSTVRTPAGRGAPRRAAPGTWRSSHSSLGVREIRGRRRGRYAAGSRPRRRRASARGSDRRVRRSCLHESSRARRARPSRGLTAAVVSR